MAAGIDTAIDARSLELLEFPTIQARLAGRASFDGGAALAREVVPSGDPEVVRRLRRETEEAFALEEQAVTGPGGASDLRDGIGLVARGGVLDVVDLERLDATIAVAVEVRAAVGAHREQAPELAERLEVGVQPAALSNLVAALERTLDRRGGIRDSASPELGEYRRRASAARRDASDMLRRLATRLGAHLQETFTTQRGGRPVLAVKASSRSAVPGIVHDTSASGNTLFVEPLELLGEMAERVRQVASELTSAIEALAGHDLALARARLSYEWQGCVVEDAREPELVGARHPLLDPHRAVPIDLDLRGIRALVISGPNTGGKTVALKTLGMLAALSQCGLRAPAKTARLPVFDRILADIGDEQSIALSLSTFSAHVRRLSEIIAGAGHRSLVLLDEIAAGTDPDEGGPLAQAIIERLVGAGACVLVTTHLGSLKEWAVAYPGAENAAVAIDPATLRPRYAISIGSYGASHALDIAESLGLPEAVIASARSAISPGRQQSDALIRAAAKAQAQADVELARAKEEHAAAAQARRDAARLRDELEARIARNRARLQADRDEVRAQAVTDLAAASSELAELREQIRAARRSEAQRRTSVDQSAGADDVRSRDRFLAAASDAERRAQEVFGDSVVPAEHLAGVGDAVRDAVMGFRGVVVAVEGDVAVVQGDRARLRVPLGRLVADVRGQRPATAPPPLQEVRPPVVAVPAQLDVRGERAAEACAQVRAAVDAAAIAGRDRLLVVHGIGTGALRAAVREELTRHPLVDRVDPAPPKEGGDGATYAVLESS
jgi:DNA mismatch repair protein MutS2